MVRLRSWVCRTAFLLSYRSLARSGGRRTPQPPVWNGRSTENRPCSGPQPGVCHGRCDDHLRRSMLRSCVCRPVTALPTELPADESAGRESNPRPVREAITGFRSGPQQREMNVAVLVCGRVHGFEPLARSRSQRTEPLRPATIVHVRRKAGPPGFEPGPARLELAMLPVTPWTYARVRKEPPAGVEPAPRPYKGRVLAVDTTKARWRRRESNPRLPWCKQGGLPQASPRIFSPCTDRRRRRRPSRPRGASACATRGRSRHGG